VEGEGFGCLIEQRNLSKRRAEGRTVRRTADSTHRRRLPLREKHSKLGAFWHTEFGPLNQVIHVYPYEDACSGTNVF
jgi:hypothetical protein